MVNTGKPSGACGVCRERRIKCDETKPVCLKCTRSGRTCTGYSHGLKLRDQTQKTITKARLGKPRTSKGGQRRSSEDTPAAAHKNTTTTTKSPTTTPASTASAPSPRQKKVVKSRSLSLPGVVENGGWLTNGDDHVGKKRKKSAAAAQKESWSFEWQVEEDALIDPLLWQTIDTPIVDQARCYFLSSKCFSRETINRSKMTQNPASSLEP